MRIKVCISLELVIIPTKFLSCRYLIAHAASLHFIQAENTSPIYNSHFTMTKEQKLKEIDRDKLTLTEEELEREKRSEGATLISE